ncbi:hypothetical protein GCM10011360_17400 [Primorskyibacter flagellatus]|uniref:Uncharacterized protein n=1 Tax=Primorskyibacter flagellatus TaxID=1387277 RepID=A0A917A5W5_9RHOB|nr:hypothetical protein [Primorskyibacter flagellatus]GGE29866.1 hypothetical protein GCM10011360_17400 [Primorskyibacter flagellatus]
MTKEDFLPRTRTFIGLMRDMFWLVTIVTPMMLLMLYGLYSLNKDWIVGTVRKELGIEKLATQESVEAVSQKVENLSNSMANKLNDVATDVRRATGDDKVIRQEPGLSYVEEPVSPGQNVILWLRVARTRLGKDCRLVDWTPLFVDAQNVPFAGSKIHNGVRRQISDKSDKLRIEMIPPKGLIPGRIELYLVLDYDCAGARVPDKTDTVTYRLLEK